MLTAQEARQLKSTEPSKTEIESVEAGVRSAALEGKSKFWYYKGLSPQMKNYLTRHGYKFDEQWDRNEYMALISWGEDE